MSLSKLSKLVKNGKPGLVCCNLWSLKELDTTEQLNWTKSLIINSECVFYFA